MLCFIEVHLNVVFQRSGSFNVVFQRSASFNVARRRLPVMNLTSKVTTIDAINEVETQEGNEVRDVDTMVDTHQSSERSEVNKTVKTLQSSEGEGAITMEGSFFSVPAVANCQDEGNELLKDSQDFIYSTERLSDTAAVR